MPAAVSATFIVFAGMSFVRRWIVLPLEELLSGALVLKQGQLDYRIAIPPGDEIGEVAASFNKIAEALMHERDTLRRLTIVDPLTGLLNVKEFRRLLKLEIARCERHSHQFVVMMMDIDLASKADGRDRITVFAQLSAAQLQS